MRVLSVIVRHQIWFWWVLRNYLQLRTAIARTEWESSLAINMPLAGVLVVVALVRFAEMNVTVCACPQLKLSCTGLFCIRGCGVGSIYWERAGNSVVHEHMASVYRRACNDRARAGHLHQRRGGP